MQPLFLASWGHVALLAWLVETACSSVYLVKYFGQAVASCFLAVSREKKVVKEAQNSSTVTRLPLGTSCWLQLEAK